MKEIATVFGLDWRLLIIQVVNFGFFLLVLWYFLYNPILKIIDERQKKIEGGIEDAEKATLRLEEIEVERDEILKEASNTASDILETSKGRAQEQSSQITTDANKRADSILSGANLRGKEMKEKALRESKEEIGRAAILAAEKVLRKNQT